MSDVTQILAKIESGDSAATDQLLPLVYQELRRLALGKLRKERPDHTLQATALVHEAYLRLVGDKSESSWSSRGLFFAAAAEAMRRILVESVRRKKSLKRGGGLERIELDTFEFKAKQQDAQLLALDLALSRLEEIDPVKANLVKLRFFSGMTKAEAAKALEIPPRTADRQWAYARAWLLCELRAGDE